MSNASVINQQAELTELVWKHGPKDTIAIKTWAGWGVAQTSLIHPTPANVVSHPVLLISALYHFGAVSPISTKIRYFFAWRDTAGPHVIEDKDFVKLWILPVALPCQQPFKDAKDAMYLQKKLGLWRNRQERRRLSKILKANPFK